MIPFTGMEYLGLLVYFLHNSIGVPGGGFGGQRTLWVYVYILININEDIHNWLLQSLLDLVNSKTMIIVDCRVIHTFAISNLE